LDIGSNLSDPIFRGIYNGKQVHEDDFHQILQRARKFGVEKQILTGDCLTGSTQVIELSHQHHGLYATVGCHPCRANEFETPIDQTHPTESLAELYLSKLEELIQSDQRLERSKRKVVAIGECGLDYDRLSYASKEVQLRHFPPQLSLARKYKLPLFLHSRTPEAHTDLVSILKTHHDLDPLNLLPPRQRGVVHSFTGTHSEMEELIELGYSIGINGCSLKTEENLNVVKSIPLDRLMLETDCPWCDIRKSHASFQLLSDLPPEFLIKSIKKEKFQSDQPVLIKGRNEPCTIFQVAWIVSKLLNLDVNELMKIVWKNSMDLFQLDLLD
ncbi:uncharacterized protein MELLADRAFT_37460, partial [Melampsora larici-populina 98AG31]